MHQLPQSRRRTECLLNLAKDKIFFFFPVKASDVLWNLYSYYKQFIPCIEQSLQEARKPIEKELKVCYAREQYSKREISRLFPEKHDFCFVLPRSMFLVLFSFSIYYLVIFYFRILSRSLNGTILTSGL